MSIALSFWLVPAVAFFLILLSVDYREWNGESRREQLRVFLGYAQIALSWPWWGGRVLFGSLRRWVKALMAGAR